MAGAAVRARHKRRVLYDPHTTQPTARPLGRSGISFIAAAMLLLVAIVGASAWQASRNADALSMAQATRAQRNLIAAVMLAVEDAETSQRGFLLTGDSGYLQPLQHAQSALPGLFAALAVQRPGDPVVVELKQSVDHKLAELQHTVSLAQANDMAGALAVVKTNAGRSEMVRVRALVNGLEGALDVTLVSQVATITRGGRLLVAIDLAGLVMVLALTGLVALGLRGYLATLSRAQRLMAVANETLERSNEQLDETVRLRTADLSAANEEIQRFAYIVSHDLRAPLVNIMGFTSELEQAAGTLGQHAMLADASAAVREAVQADIPEALRFIKSSTSKMDRLINAILKLSREGRRVLAPEHLDMAGLLATMTESMRHQMTQKEAAIEIGALPDIVADRFAVDQIFSNVIENALKYLKPGRPGVISVRGQSEGAMARYDIADNGRGIAERDYERVFELFRRAGDQSVPGEGIGLAHVRALVRRLGGHIECRSTLDVGTTFTIRLPLVPHHTTEYAA